MAAYLEWEAEQEVRHELVDGELHTMVGGTAAHGTISLNICVALRTALRGTGCQVFGSDFKVATGNGNARYPDAHVHCSRLSQDAVIGPHPVAVFEVLSKSTARFDRNLKLRDYAATSSIRYYTLLAQDAPEAMLYARDAEGLFNPGDVQTVEGIEGVIRLPDIDVALAMADIYLEIPFGPV